MESPNRLKNLKLRLANSDAIDRYLSDIDDLISKIKIWKNKSPRDPSVGSAIEDYMGFSERLTKL